MSLSRRKTLALIGGGTILAAGGWTAHVVTRTPDRARAPWDAAGEYEEPRRFALSYAILAPNPHNRQPWIAELAGDDTIVIHRDRSMNLPETDPHDRQLTIGMGCFLEGLDLAAGARGYRVETALFPDGPDGPTARAVFRDGGTKNPLFDHMLDRRSCKEPFQNRVVPAGPAAELGAHAEILTDAQTVDALRELTWKAFLVEAETPRTFKESVDLMRLGKSEIEANPDGIDLGGGMLELMIATGLMSREAQLDPTSTAYKEGIRIYDEMLSATPAYAVVTTQGNTRADQIAAGRRWMRLNLAATGHGLALHPVSQALQEYPEMAALYREAHDQLAPEDHTVQMLGRLGYGPEIAPAPRWPLEKKLRNG